MGYTYYDFDKKEKKENINFIFNDWDKGNESVVIYSPHDDDAILGAGYILNAALKNGAEVFVFIFCNGCGGYSNLQQKNKIVNIRKEESIEAYEMLNIPRENIIRFEYPDFSANSRIGWQLPNDRKGGFYKALHKLREIKATRLLIPNGYREHLDHESVFKMGSYHAPQAGDPILIDFGKPTKIKSVLEYSVWGDFSPEDAFINERSTKIRANVGIRVNYNLEKKIKKAINKFESQSKIIENLIRKREERKIEEDYLEVYRNFNARPTINYSSYVNYIKNKI